MSDETTSGGAGAGATPDAVDLDEELQQLLKEQEEFLRQSKRPAAKVSRVGPARAATSATDQPQEQEQEPPVDGPQVLGSVVERDVVELNFRNVNVMPRAQAGGFPAVQRRGESLFGKRQRRPTSASGPLSTPAAAAGSKPSRFSAMRKAAVAEREAEATQGLDDPERQEIDRSNRARLSEMSVAEIRAAQQELVASLDPALVKKLLGRQQQKQQARPVPSASKRSAGTGTGVGVIAGTTIVPHEKKEIKDDDDDALPVAVGRRTPLPPPAAPLDLAKIRSEDELRAQAQLLPPDERAKHEWMQAPAPPPSAPPPTRDANANAKTRKEKRAATTERFDFSGDRVGGSESASSAQAIPAHSGLFHHGDEPEAAGYTMGELVHLARSTVASQRAMALTTVAKILRKREVRVTRGDLASVVPRVLPSDLPVTLRIALDDQNYSALSAAVGALHAFLVPSQQPVASSRVLDGRFGVVVPPPRTHLHPNVIDTGSQLELETSPTEEVVYVATGEADDGSTLSDAELTFLDPVQGFLSMDIGTRLRFVLESVQLPDPSARAQMLDILVQLANHSPRAAEAIGTNARLMKAVQRTFIESEDVLALQDASDVALRLAAKALALVRALCQGSRAVASVLIGNGVIQSTKGFLAVRSESAGAGASEGDSAATLFRALQVESLRVWRVLLTYGLDYHCFAYLYPVLCGFGGADLVRPAGEQRVDESAPRPAASVMAALFAALEAFCGLQAVHEAQHYFGQLDIFVRQAKDEVLARLTSPAGPDCDADNNVNDSDADDAGVLAAALRFLAASAALVTKFHLDRSSHVAVFERLHADARDVWAALAARDDDGAAVLSAAVDFHQRVLANDLLGDDTDDADAAGAFLTRAKPLVLAATTRGIARLGRTAREREDASAHLVPQLCHLLTLASNLLAAAPRRYEDDAFVAALYAHALSLMEAFVRGHEFWLRELLTTLLFRPAVLQRVGLFPSERDVVAAARVLVPVYHALVNASAEQEAHSHHQFAAAVAVADASSPTLKSSCQLRCPQTEDAYVGANLPLPGFWLFSPLSRTEFASRGAAAASDPTRAESDEMKLVVSATCRFLCALETASASLEIWRGVDVAYQRELRADDKFFHLLHVFFAGADVLFDPLVDAALAQAVQQFAAPVVRTRSGSPTLLFDAVLRNLRQFQRLDPNSNTTAAAATPPPSGSNGSTAFATDEQVVLTFVEQLVAEFTSSSFGNAHFARCVTLLLASDFPVAIRRWLWRELAACRLLPALQPLADSEEATFARCTRLRAAAHDEQLLQAMAQALSQQQVTAARGAFAFAVAVHHVTAYLFSDTALSFARQTLAQELVRDAPASVWRCLLSYEPTSRADAATAPLKPERVLRITTQAALAPELLATFVRLCDAASSAT
ncbi:hypothetical protein PybrP1_008291 [[Pythium] brassicae (nom. inval.)]|nr:hypothetical protein PybrP1_008291 [[Pythium] brassicae (nom. inval.)]